MSPTPILVVCTTNRPRSLTATVATYYLELLKDKTVPCQLCSMAALPADFTTSALYANKGKNKSFNVLTDLFDQFEKFVFVVPQYNGSFPGVFKAFIDGYASPKIFKDKKAALIGVSKGFQGAIIGLSHLTDIFHYLGMTLYPIQPKLSGISDTGRETLLGKADYRSLLSAQATGFIAF